MRRDILLALGVFALLALVMTWPMVLHMDQLFASGAEDVAYCSWNIWWGAQALAQGANPFYTTALFHPEGVSILWREFGVFCNLAAAPLTLAFGTPFAYNATFLLSFVLAGLGAFLLARLLTGSRLAGLGAGLAYAFTPTHFLAYSTHAYVHTQWIPFLFWSLLLLQRSGRWRHALLAGAWLALCLQWSSMHYGIYGGMAVVLLGLWYGFVPGERVQDRLRWWKGIGLVLAVAFLLTSFRLVPMVLEALQGVETQVPPKNFADLLGFRARVGGSRPIQIVGWPSIFGYTVVAGALLACWKCGWKRSRLWLVVAGVFFVLGLGATLSVAGRDLPGVPTPTDLLRLLPMLGSMRFEALAMMFVVLALAVLFAFFLRSLEERAQAAGRAGGRPLAALAVLLLAAVELRPPSQEPHPDAIPAWYHALAGDESVRAILSLPCNYEVSARTMTRPMLLQTAHGKPIISGHVSGRPDPKREGRYYDHPFLVPFLGTQRQSEARPFPIPDAAAAAGFRDDLRSLGVDLVILYTQNVLPEEGVEERPEPKRVRLDWTVLLAPVWYGPLAGPLSRKPFDQDEQQDSGWEGRKRTLHHTVIPFLEAVLGEPKTILGDGGMVWRVPAAG